MSLLLLLLCCLCVCSFFVQCFWSVVPYLGLRAGKGAEVVYARGLWSRRWCHKPFWTGPWSSSTLELRKWSTWSASSRTKRARSTRTRSRAWCSRATWQIIHPGDVCCWCARQWAYRRAARGHTAITWTSERPDGNRNAWRRPKRRPGGSSPTRSWGSGYLSRGDPDKIRGGGTDAPVSRPALRKVISASRKAWPRTAMTTTSWGSEGTHEEDFSGLFVAHRGLGAGGPCGKWPPTAPPGGEGHRRCPRAPASDEPGGRDAADGHVGRPWQIRLQERPRLLRRLPLGAPRLPRRGGRTAILPGLGPGPRWPRRGLRLLSLASRCLRPAWEPGCRCGELFT